MNTKHIYQYPDYVASFNSLVLLDTARLALGMMVTAGLGAFVGMLVANSLNEPMVDKIHETEANSHSGWNIAHTAPVNLGGETLQLEPAKTLLTPIEHRITFHATTDFENAPLRDVCDYQLTFNASHGSKWVLSVHPETTDPEPTAPEISNPKLSDKDEPKRKLSAINSGVINSIQASNALISRRSPATTTGTTSLPNPDQTNEPNESVINVLLGAYPMEKNWLATGGYDRFNLTLVVFRPAIDYETSNGADLHFSPPDINRIQCHD